jgi:hypothetical protein
MGVALSLRFRPCLLTLSLPLCRWLTFIGRAEVAQALACLRLRLQAAFMCRAYSQPLPQELQASLHVVSSMFMDEHVAPDARPPSAGFGRAGGRGGSGRGGSGRNGRDWGGSGRYGARAPQHGAPMMAAPPYNPAPPYSQGPMHSDAVAQGCDSWRGRGRVHGGPGYAPSAPMAANIPQDNGPAPPFARRGPGGGGRSSGRRDRWDGGRGQYGQ